MPRVFPVIAYMFSSMIMGILDAPLAEGRRRLQPRAARMWEKAVNDIWPAEQAFEGMARAIVSGAASRLFGRLTRHRRVRRGFPAAISSAIEGSSYSGLVRREMVAGRAALGLLPPPWALAITSCSKPASPIDSVGPFRPTSSWRR